MLTNGAAKVAVVMGSAFHAPGFVRLSYATSMKNVELNVEVKEDIIGGFILETGDLLIDASIAFDLNNIKKQFKNNDFIYKIR